MKNSNANFTNNLLTTLATPHEKKWTFLKTLSTQNNAHSGYNSGIVYHFDATMQAINTAGRKQVVETNHDQQSAFHLLFKHSLFTSLDCHYGFVLNGGYDSKQKIIYIASVDNTRVTSERFHGGQEVQDPRQQKKQYSVTAEDGNTPKILAAINNTAADHRNAIVVAWLQRYTDNLFEKFSENTQDLCNALSAIDKHQRSALSYAIEHINNIHDDASRATLTTYMKAKLSDLLTRNPSEAVKLLKVGGSQGHSALNLMEKSASNTLWLDNEFSSLVLTSLKTVNSSPSWYLPYSKSSPEYFNQTIGFLLQTENTELCKNILECRTYPNQETTLLSLLAQRQDIEHSLVAGLLQFILNTNDSNYIKRITDINIATLWSFARNENQIAILIEPAVNLLAQRGEFNLETNPEPQALFRVIHNIHSIANPELGIPFVKSAVAHLTQQLDLLSNHGELKHLLDNRSDAITTMLTSAWANQWFEYFMALLNRLHLENNENNLLDDYLDKVAEWLYLLANNPETSAENIQTTLTFLALNNPNTPADDEYESKKDAPKKAVESVDSYITQFVLTKVQANYSLLHLLFKHQNVSLENLTAVTQWLLKNSPSKQNTSMLDTSENLLRIAHERLSTDGQTPAQTADALTLAASLYQANSKVYKAHAFQLLTVSAGYKKDINMVRRALAELLDFDTWCSVLLTKGSSKPVEEVFAIRSNESATPFGKAFRQALLPYQLQAIFKHYFSNKKPGRIFTADFDNRASNFLLFIDYWLNGGANAERPRTIQFTSSNTTSSYKLLIEQATAEPITSPSQQKLAFQKLYILAQAKRDSTPANSVFHQFCQKLTEKLAAFEPPKPPINHIKTSSAPLQEKEEIEKETKNSDYQYTGTVFNMYPPCNDNEHEMPPVVTDAWVVPGYQPNAKKDGTGG